MRVDSIKEVVNAQLCTGCGACAYMEPLRFYMADTLEFGRRPFERDLAARETGEALLVCPGIGLVHDRGLYEREGALQALLDGWGPVLGVWEGYAADPEIRLAGSSGGAASALSLYCLEKESMAGVLHTASLKGAPILNETVMSTNRGELLARTGSRYAPASPAEGLMSIENAPTKCVFIGKPCDTAAVENARKLRPLLDEKIGLVIAFFCAGVPSLKGNLELLKAQGVEDTASIRELRYRGNGWPGMWQVRFDNSSGDEETRQTTYAESWDFLQRYRQWRCYICPDHTGEFADVAVGDPWYRRIGEGEPGKSLIVARTKRGLETIKAAEKSGYLILESEDSSLLPRSQPNLLKTRGNIFARLIVLRIFGAGVPNYRGFKQFKYWLHELSFYEKVQSISATIKRVFVKKLRTRLVVEPWSQSK